MFPNVLSREALALLKELALEPQLASYRLVGGTALALQRGHRKSIDLDFFSVAECQSAELENLLIKKYEAKDYSMASSGKIIFCYIRSVKVDIVSYPYAWIDRTIEWEGVALASPKEISAMKISAIGQRGSKKDFFDFTELLKIFSLEEMLAFFSTRYPHANKMHYLQALTYFDDAENDPDPEILLEDMNWVAVKVKIQKAVAGIFL